MAVLAKREMLDKTVSIELVSGSPQEEEGDTGDIGEFPMGFQNGCCMNLLQIRPLCYWSYIQGWHHIHNDKYEYMGSDCGDCICQKA